MNDTPMKRFWRVIYPIGLYVLMQFGVVLAGELVVFAYVMMKNSAAGAAPDMLALVTEVTEIMVQYTYEFTVLSAVLTLPFLILFAWMDVRRKRKTGTLKRYARVPVWTYLLVIGLGVTVCIVGNNLVTFSGLMEVFDGYEDVAATLYKGQLLFEIIGIGLIVPATEEMIFRVLVYGRFREFVSPMIAGAVSSMAFAVFHGNVVQAVYAFLMGVVLCFAYERYHSFWAPYLLHASANILSVVVTEVPTLHPIVEEGPVFYVATLVCAVLVVLFMYLLDRHVNPKEIVEAQPQANV